MIGILRVAMSRRSLPPHSAGSTCPVFLKPVKFHRRGCFPNGVMRLKHGSIAGEKPRLRPGFLVRTAFWPCRSLSIRWPCPLNLRFNHHP